jgi:hypothetical protein
MNADLCKYKEDMTWAEAREPYSIKSIQVPLHKSSLVVGRVVTLEPVTDSSVRGAGEDSRTFLNQK